MRKLKLSKFRAITSGIVSLLLITLALAYLYRDDIFQTIQDPGQPFQTYQPPTAPNYASLDSWLAQPDLNVDPYTLTAKGDVFVVVPSVYRGGEHWNLSSDDLKRKGKLERIVRPNYVTPYGESGRLFAPFYRQASLYAFMTNREDAHQAQDLAYRDVRRAFEAFIKQSPPERPIVLVPAQRQVKHNALLPLDHLRQRTKSSQNVLQSAHLCMMAINMFQLAADQHFASTRFSGHKLKITRPLVYTSAVSQLKV